MRSISSSGGNTSCRNAATLASAWRDVGHGFVSTPATRHGAPKSAVSSATSRVAPSRSANATSPFEIRIDAGRRGQRRVAPVGGRATERVVAIAEPGHRRRRQIGGACERERERAGRDRRVELEQARRGRRRAKRGCYVRRPHAAVQQRRAADGAAESRHRLVAGHDGGEQRAVADDGPRGRHRHGYGHDDGPDGRAARQIDVVDLGAARGARQRADTWNRDSDRSLFRRSDRAADLPAYGARARPPRANRATAGGRPSAPRASMAPYATAASRAARSASATPATCCSTWHA